MSNNRPVGRLFVLRNGLWPEKLFLRLVLFKINSEFCPGMSKYCVYLVTSTTLFHRNLLELFSNTQNMKKKLFVWLLMSAVCVAGVHAANGKKVRTDGKKIVVSVSEDVKNFDIVVAKDGSGNFTTIQEAIESIRAFKPGPRTRVLIKNGVYEEKVVVHTWVTNVVFVGESVEGTVITWADHANINKMGTFRTHTLLVQGNDITFENLTIRNNAPQLGQAVALHVEGDRVAFFNCRILGNQDTIYTGREASRYYFANCYIDGTTDYIFGPGTAWFEACELHCKRNSFVTAASTPEYIKYGYIFDHCKITADNTVTKMALGRPWRAYGMTLFMNTEMGEFIAPGGWNNWGNPENEKTARFMEYNNYGPGAQPDKRNPWSKQLTKRQAAEYTLSNVLGDWDPLAAKFYK